jgi:hypothetical protein
MIIPPEKQILRKQQIAAADKKAYEIVMAAKFFLICGHMHDVEWWQRHFTRYVVEFDALWAPISEDETI